MIRNVSKTTLLGSLNFNTLQIIAKVAYKVGVPRTFYILLKIKLLHFGFRLYSKVLIIGIILLVVLNLDKTGQSQPKFQFFKTLLGPKIRWSKY